MCEYPYEGSIRYNGCELRNAADNVRSGIISYLGHDPELFNDSVRNNVLLGDDYDVFEYLRAVCMDKEVEAMEQGADTIIGSEGIRLSGGQAQRIALARMLCHKKLVLVLDDPFSALDRNTEEQIYKKLKDMASDNIVILISHRLYMFPKMDKVIWMDAGKANVGTHKELMLECPGYRKMYETVSVEECRTVETENEGLAEAKVVENSRRVVDKHE